MQILKFIWHACLHLNVNLACMSSACKLACMSSLEFFSFPQKYVVFDFYDDRPNSLRSVPESWIASVLTEGASVTYCRWPSPGSVDARYVALIINFNLLHLIEVSLVVTCGYSIFRSPSPYPFRDLLPVPIRVPVKRKSHTRTRPYPYMHLCTNTVFSTGRFNGAARPVKIWADCKIRPVETAAAPFKNQPPS